jgi:hypothetical protein
MAEAEKLVGVVSPWDRLSELVKRGFRVESLPAEKHVMVWRDDLQTKRKLERELTDLGVGWTEIKKRQVTTKWKDVK